MVNTSNRLLKVTEVADYLNCTTTWVYLLVKQGKLKTVKVGSRAVRIPQDSLDAYIKGQGA